VDLTYKTPIHLAAGERDRTAVPIADALSLRKIRGPFRVRFIFESHGRRHAVTRIVRR
jgi:hypothetical protein